MMAFVNESRLVGLDVGLVWVDRPPLRLPSLFLFQAEPYGGGRHALSMAISSACLC